MPNTQGRPILLLLTDHWVSMLGTSLVTFSGVSWLFALPLELKGHVGNPYIGLLLFVALPIVFFVGLALIPVGIVLAKRRITKSMAEIRDQTASWVRAGTFFAIMTMANLIIGSQFSYRAVEQMDTVQFCGQSCHVMNPEFTAHQLAPHRAVYCVDCHVEPGASGWVESKISGMRQLKGVLLNSYRRPIESAMASNRLPPSSETCGQCHDRKIFIGSRLRILTGYDSDESNTRNETVLLMFVGGGNSGGIHGIHMGPGVHIRYAAADKQRQTIPWVEYRAGASATRTYLAGNANTAAIRNLPTFDMQCVDCHNRTAHSFESPSRAVDSAIARGQICTDLPYVKKKGVELIKAVYRSKEEAGQKISAGLTAFYEHKYPDIYRKRAEDIRAAGQALFAVYDRNVFPDLKVTWGTYPNNLGHMDFPGCFRCHDGDHATPDNKTIPQDCTVCHQLLAVQETSPEVLRMLELPGVDEPVATGNYLIGERKCESF